MAKQKFHVVWIGRNTGVFDSWDHCNTQVKGYSGAKFKSFNNQHLAKKAFSSGVGLQ